MSTKTASLIVSLIDRVTAPSRAISRAMQTLNQASKNNTRELKAVQGQMLGAVGAAYALQRAISAPIGAAMEFESAMADVRKVVDFETPEQFDKLSTDILNLSRTLPLTATGIAEIVAAAGQAGMGGDELLDFATMAAKVGVAFDLSANEVGTSLSRIKTALGLTVDETGLLADAINHLTNNMASSAPEMVVFMNNVAATGEQYGFAAAETAAIGSAMIAAGSKADVASTSFRNVGRALTKGASATTAQKKAFKTLGLSSTQLAKDMQKDAAGTLRDVIMRIKTLPEHMQAATLSQIFGDEARALAPLVQRIELFDQALAAISDTSKYAGSAMQEFAVRSDTAENKMQTFKNLMQELATRIGDALLPALIDITDRLRPFIIAFADYAAANPQVVAAVVAITASLVGLNIALIATRFAFLFMKGGALSAATGVVRGASMISSTGAGIANFAGMVKRLGLAMTLLSATGGTGLMSGLVSGLIAAGTAIGAAIAGVTAPVWGLIAAIIAVLAALGIAIYKYWEPISNFFGGLGEVLGAAIGAVASAIGAAAVGLATAFVGIFGIDAAQLSAGAATLMQSIQNTWSNIVSYVMGLPAQLGNLLGDLFKMNDYSDAEEANFKDMGRRMGTAIVDGIKGFFTGGLDWLQGMLTFVADISMGAVPSVLNWLQSIANGMINFALNISWPKIPSFWQWLSSAGSAVLSMFVGGGGEGALAGARAAGGPVKAGLTYMTGERGRELFTAPTDGYVHNALDTARMMSGLSSGLPSAPMPPSMGGVANNNAANANGVTTQTISVGPIYLSNATNANPNEIGRAVGREVALRVRGTFTDGGV